MVERRCPTATNWITLNWGRKSSGEETGQEEATNCIFSPHGGHRSSNCVKCWVWLCASLLSRIPHKTVFVNNSRTETTRIQMWWSSKHTCE
jgi:hypothetical protein